MPERGILEPLAPAKQVRTAEWHRLSSVEDCPVAEAMRASQDLLEILTD
jgi:hypothetical protein